MKKQIIIAATFLITSFAAWVVITSHTKAEETPSTPTCSQKCGDQIKTTPSSGIFIINSFPGIL
ncbi:MAG: hypothetical protein K2X48_08315 [Chitinophagaceae bacterium]|nr:hypothetical protein [Chitinophagaceae bacterium]